MTISNYTGSATWNSTIPVFDDAEPPAASIISTPLEALANRTKYLGQHCLVQEGGYDSVHSEDISSVGSTTSDTESLIVSFGYLYNARPGDRLKIHANFYGKVTSTSAGWLRLVVTNNGINYVPNQNRVYIPASMTELRQYSLIGYYDMPAPITNALTAISIWGRLESAAGSLEVHYPLGFSWELYRPL